MDPTSRPDKTLLEYARHYGISEDPITRSPDSYLIDSGLDNIFPDPAPSSPHSMRERHQELDSQLGDYLNHERLDIRIQDGRVLASIRRLEREGATPKWNELLPPLQKMGSFKSEPLLKTQKEEEDRALEMDDGDPDAFLCQQEELTLTELRKSPEVPEERPSSSSRSSSIRLVQSQSNRRAAHNTTAFVETVLAISKTTRDGTPPRSSLALPSPSMRHSSIRADLGSLDDFMASRGIVVEPPTDPSFPSNNTPGYQGPPFPTYANTTLPVNLMPPPSIPEDQRQTMKDQVLYLSSDLLKTHLPLIQSLEILPNPPHLVWRDYDASKKVEDADIIVPPTTGIILTTAQALTQRPLPGEEKEHRCPVLARIYRLAPRYEHFYVLVVSAKRVNRRTADALAFLKVFCGQASDNATVIPVKISSEDVLDWVLGIAFEKGGRG